MQKSNSFKKIVSDENAVSPVIGVILMVAVTVILAAVIAAFVFGFAGNMPKSPNVAYFNIERTGEKTITISNDCPLVVELSNVHFYVDSITPANELGSTVTGDLSKYGATQAITNGPASPAALGVSALVDEKTHKIIVTGQVNGAPLQTLLEITV